MQVQDEDDDEKDKDEEKEADISDTNHPFPARTILTIYYEKFIYWVTRKTRHKQPCSKF